VKLALVLPAGTVTFGGVTTSPSMLPLSQTKAPPAGAGPVSVTMPLVLLSPMILLLASDKAARLGAGAGLPAGIRVSQFSGARYPSTAVPELMITRVGTETGAVPTSKVAPVPPAGMEILAGAKTNAVSLLTSVISTPPGGAGLRSVTVPVKVFPPIILSSLSPSPQSIGHKPTELCCHWRA
jgi:hypothetical protein